MSGVEERIPGGQDTPRCTSGAGLVSLVVARSLHVDGGKELSLPTAVREKDARLHMPANAGSSRALKTQHQNGLHAKQGHQNLEFSSPDF